MEVQLKPEKMNKKVSIVVPVYNAEKYLGHCLNSLLSQTYLNWTAILVNDGSKDASLEICNQYAKLDARFKVYSKENGGVSSARNYGLQYAEGDYLAFLDSDDCLAEEALEKMVNLAEEYQSPLVMMDIMQVDFSKPEAGKNMLTSAWLKKSPCVLTTKEFKEKYMRLVWYTVLLECLHAKLYDLSLWKKLGLTFPEELSLGEDFVTNMKYFEACEKVVFVRECGHYYNCITGSESLTQKYRPDLFETKMYLITEMENYVGGVENLSADEKDAFACYIASGGLYCVERLVLDSGMGKKQMIGRIGEMFENSQFKNAVLEASYIPERFAGCIKDMQKGQYEPVIEYIADREYEKSIKTNEQLAPTDQLVNKVLRKCFRILRRIFSRGRMGERLIRWEKELLQDGLKHVIKSHIRAHKKVRINHLEQQIDRVDAQNESIKWELMQKTEAVDEKVEAVDEKVEAVDEKVEAVDKKIERAVKSLDENINGYIWYSEQRMLKESYRQEINDLRQRKKAILLATAEHANIGDSAITMAQQQVLLEQMEDYYQVEISTYEFEKKEDFLHAILNPSDIIFINGGGNMGDLYSEEEELHRKIVSEFPNNQIVIFPQTVAFSDTEKGRSELEKSAYVYNHHENLTLFVRGKNSYDFAKEHFSKVKIFLMADMVHVLRSRYAFEREGILLCVRNDVEGKLAEEAKQKIIETAKRYTEKIDFSTNIHSEDVPREIRGMVVRRELMRFAHQKVVVTDRLHGMIFSVVTGTPCVVLASCNHKIYEYYQSFFSDSNAVIFVGDALEEVDGAIEKALKVTDPVYPIFDRNPHKDFCAYFK